MKYSSISLIIATSVILTSMSDCEATYKVHAPVSIEIDGVPYRSDYVEQDRWWTVGNVDIAEFNISENGFSFKTCYRELISESADTIFIRLQAHEEFDDIDFQWNTQYPIRADLYTGDYEANDITDGWIKFISVRNDRVSGNFEFTVTNPDTGEAIYYVKNGEFDLPY